MACSGKMAGLEPELANYHSDKAFFFLFIESWRGGLYLNFIEKNNSQGDHFLNRNYEQCKAIKK